MGPDELLAPITSGTDLTVVSRSAVEALIQPLTSTARDLLLVDMLMDRARDLIRLNVWRVERAARETAAIKSKAVSDAEIIAEQEARRKLAQRMVRPPGSSRKYNIADLYKGRYVHGSSSKNYGAVTFGCVCEKCADWREVERRLYAKRDADIRELMKEFATELKLEWTADLLASSFALRDGSVVTWGAATISDHEARIEMLEASALGTLTTAAQHIKAVDAIKAGKVATLADL